MNEPISAPVEITEAHRWIIKDLSSPYHDKEYFQNYCTGTVLTARVAAMVGVSVGVGGHFCSFRNGMRGIYIGGIMGSGLGLGAMVDASIDHKKTISHFVESDTFFTNEMEDDNYYAALVFQVRAGTSKLNDKTVINPGLGIGMYSGMDTIGGEVKIIPLPTDWTSFLRNHGIKGK